MKSEMKKILSNTVWMTFDKVFMLLLNLIVTFKVANYFGSFDYGNYQYAVSIVAIFEILIAFVDGRVVKKRYINVDPDILVYNATICRVIFSIIACFAGGIYILITNRNIEFSIMFFILLINAVFVNLRFGMANRFEYLLKSKKIVIAADSAALIASGLQLLAVSFKLSIISIAVIQLISSLINMIILVLQYNVEFKERKKNIFDLELVGGLIKESVPLAIASSCATIYTRCDSVMIGSLMTIAEVGVYSISAKLISVVQIALIPIRESFYPRLIQLYSTDKKKYASEYIKISSILTWTYIVGVLISFVILPTAFKYLNEEYTQSYPIYRIYVLGTFFMYNAGLRAGHFTLINRGSVLTYTQIFSGILNVILNYILISSIGLSGAAIATVITQACSLLGSNLMFGEEGREVFVWQLKALNPLYAFMGILRLKR